MFKIDRFDGRKSSLATKLKIVILWMPIVFTNVKKGNLIARYNRHSLK